MHVNSMYIRITTDRYKQPMGFDAQLARTARGKCPRNVRILMQDYKSLRLAVTIHATLVNTHTQTNTQADSFRPVILLAQLSVQQAKTRNSSGDEIANVNFLYDDIVHVLQNTIDSCIHSATDRHGYVLERMFTKFSEITQYNGHYAIQGHSRSPILVPIESSYTTSY